MGQAQINVRTRACSRTSIARTRQAALTHNVRGKELKSHMAFSSVLPFLLPTHSVDCAVHLLLCHSRALLVNSALFLPFTALIMPFIFSSPR